jgi:TetR/AcrR family transcriptional regulator, copper-responsive repressor
MGRPKNFSREEVLEKGMPVFWKHGFADTSLQDLERATGVNKSGLYTEFRDKEDLLAINTLANPIRTVAYDLP